MTPEPPSPERAFEQQVSKIVQHIGVVYNIVLNRDPDSSEIQRHGNELLQGLSPMDFLNAIVFSEERARQGRLYVAPGHFYSPVANPAELGPYLAALAEVGPEVAGIAIDREGQIAVWERLLPFLTTCEFADEPAPGQHYFYGNRAYGFGDALVLQAMIRDRAPKRIVEIGSGHSSACTVDTVDAYLNGKCELTFIEPRPERLRTLLGDRAHGVRIVDTPVQEVALDLFEQLEAGDILFIDSTHVLRAGSDVCYELFQILPRLARGVAVHIHDIFWPFEYPRAWLVDDNRSWNELYAVRAFLMENERWKILFFSDFFAKYERARVERTIPRFAENSGAALWLERR